MCVCYSPFHLAEYPLHGYESPDLLPAGMDADFKLMAQLGYTTVRTYYSNYYGYDIAPIAAKYGIRLYLGVYMTTESWYESQVTSAVNAAVNYPNTVQAILIGNENVAPYGTFTVEDIVTQMNFTRNRIFNQTNRTFPVDTCYLKSAVGTKVNLTGRRAASISATPISCSTFENDVDYSGNDIGATKQVSANLCCSDCQAVAGCQLFVWRDGTCWLKRAKGASVRVLGANAGFLPSSMSVESCGVVEPNTDYVGNDIASVAASDCCQACQSERTCNAYSQSQGKCYLKSGRSTVSTVSGVTSARVNKCSTVEVGVDYVGNDLAIDAMLHVDLNDDLAEFIDVTFASGDNVVVVVVGQRDVANDARLQTTLAELPQQVLFRRQQSMVTIEEDVELHSINRPSLGSTSERDRRKQSMVQRNSVDDKTLDNKGLEDEEYYERIVTSISTQPLEHFMASLDDESAESVADSDVSSDVSYSSTTYDAESDGHHDDTTLFESIRASDEFHRVFEWMQEYRGWSRQPGIWGSYCYIEPRTPPEHQTAETSEESTSEFLGEVAAEAKWKATGDWHRALFAQPTTVNEPVVPLTTPSRRPRPPNAVADARVTAGKSRAASMIALELTAAEASARFTGWRRSVCSTAVID
ncbi:hypothetical protein DYB25_006105 [Aphanomyces astaci]|uniref:glucan endo-1,3-beta-D-glucosidase n=1 Tax=Aphanomyces astaci TaxID=112090 RepID=A0A397BFX1_APHAT|nr:hypothetical protein DYB25_006105 [Aphanomyces astaci]